VSIRLPAPADGVPSAVAAGGSIGGLAVVLVALLARSAREFSPSR
jgi:hypothetical protein